MPLNCVYICRFRNTNTICIEKMQEFIFKALNFEGLTQFIEVTANKMKMIEKIESSECEKRANLTKSDCFWPDFEQIVESPLNGMVSKIFVFTISHRLYSETKRCCWNHWLKIFDEKNEDGQ